jgi:nucleoside 2-deoxyribosyltransferase
MAFMAMKFENPELTKIFEDHFKEAVRATGFKLKRLDEDPKAGSIDERLRVEIRRSVFLVADLTDGNQGAYWEAGFAEGLGKPVIYTCQKRFFKEVQTHFDTNHLQTVFWDENEPNKAAEELKATIRNTLPLIAKMDDE